MDENESQSNYLLRSLSFKSIDFKKKLLLIFTKELIKHSRGDFFKLEHKIKKNLQDKKDLKGIEEVEAAYEKYSPSLMYSYKNKPILKERNKLTFKPLPRPTQIMPSPNQTTILPNNYLNKIMQPRQRKVYVSPRIPEYPLPPTVQNLKPFPSDAEINLDKLNILIQDSNVNIIECDGPNERIVVKGRMGTKPTGIILTKEDIDLVLQRFSEAAKIPIGDGISKIVVGKLILSAIVSEIVGTKFIIRKMVLAPSQPIQRMPFY